MSGRIFITGGASGLGRAIALRFARARWHVAIGDVHTERLADTERAIIAAGGQALALTCDVTRESDLEVVRDAITRQWGGVDVLVNNAGVAQAGAIDEVSLADWQWILDINLLGVVRGCKVFTPGFRRQGRGHIVNVASMAGLLDVPMMASYGVSKAGVVALSEILGNELAPAGIAISVVCPSFFMSNLGESLRTPDARLGRSMQRLLASSRITAEDIADQIFTAVAERRFWVLPHLEGRVAWRLKQLLPRALYSWAMQKGLARGRRRSPEGTAR